MPYIDETDDIVRPLNDRELGILVLDGSGSMAEFESPGVTKAQALRTALGDPEHGFFARFQDSGRVNAVDFVVLVFDSQVETRIPLTPAAEIDVDDVYDRLDVLRGHGGRTDLKTALEEAGELALGFADPTAKPPLYATILLMTDGEHNVPNPDPAAVIAAAANIRQQAPPNSGSRDSIVIACAPYGSDADTATLQRIASDKSYFRKCTSAAEIRAFFIASLAARTVDR